MALTVVRDPVSGVAFSAIAGQRAYLLTEDGGQSFSFEFAPREVSYGSWEADWVQVERVGLTPLLVRKGDKLETVSFAINLAHRHRHDEVQHGHLRALQRVARSQQRVLFSYSDFEAGLWRVTSCSAASVLRHPVSDRIIRATADVELTRASDPAPGVGPVSAPAPATTPGPAPSRPQSAPRTVTVRQGDSLWSIAQRVYNDGGRWHRLHDANRDKIHQPWLIHPGQVLTVP